MHSFSEKLFIMKTEIKLLTTLLLSTTICCISCSSDDNDNLNENKEEAPINDPRLCAAWSPIDNPSLSQNNIYILNIATERQGTLLFFNRMNTTEHHSFDYQVSKKQEIVLSINSFDAPTQKRTYTYKINGDTLILTNNAEIQRYVKGKQATILGKWKSIESQKGKVKFEDLEYSVYNFYTSKTDDKYYVDCTFRDKDIIDLSTNQPALNKESHECKLINLSQMYIKHFGGDGRIFDVRYRYKENDKKVYLELSNDYFKKTFTTYEKIEEE